MKIARRSVGGKASIIPSQSRRGHGKHRRCSRPCGTLANVYFLNPPTDRRAIFDCPFGTKMPRFDSDSKAGGNLKADRSKNVKITRSIECRS